MPAVDALLRLERLCDRLSRAVVQLELELDRVDGGPTAGLTPRRRAVALDVLEYKANLIGVAALVASKRRALPPQPEVAEAEWEPCVDGAHADDYAMTTFDRYAVLDAVRAAVAATAGGASGTVEDDAETTTCVPALVQVECFFDTIALALAAPSRTANAYADTAVAEIATMRTLAVGHIRQLCPAAAEASTTLCTAGRLEAFVRELASLAADEARIPRTPGGRPSPSPGPPVQGPLETLQKEPHHQQAPNPVAPLVATAGMSEADVSTAVLRFYRAVNPAKTADVPSIVAAYVGRHELLFAMLNHKYLGHPVPDEERYHMDAAAADDGQGADGEGYHSHDISDDAAAGSGGPVVLLEYEEGLTAAEAVADVRALYEQVAPGKVAEAGSIVERHADDLERLYFLLNCKYVPGFEAHYAAALAATREDEDDEELVVEEGEAAPPPLSKDASGASHDTAPSPPHGASAIGTRAPTPAVGSPTRASPAAYRHDAPAPADADGGGGGGPWCLVA